MKKRFSAAILALLFAFPAGVCGEAAASEAGVQQEAQAATQQETDAAVQQEAQANPQQETDAAVQQEAQTDTPSVPQEELIYVDDGLVSVLSDCQALDFPGRKDGSVIGELSTSEQVRHTAILTGGWSLISFTDDQGQELSGYVPTEALDVPETSAAEVAGDGSGDLTASEDTEAGTLSPSKGEGIFAQAVEDVTAGGVQEVDGVQIGTPTAASSDASLVSLGTFRITHYCPCSICCGPWADGITSTGVTAVTNRTIAVDPTQIPYGSKVVINGQVYVAEDCGGAIKTNCIDIYVASHAEGESKGVYYTDVYLVQE